MYNLNPKGKVLESSETSLVLVWLVSHEKDIRISLEIIIIVGNNYHVACYREFAIISVVCNSYPLIFVMVIMVSGYSNYCHIRG